MKEKLHSLFQKRGAQTLMVLLCLFFSAARVRAQTDALGTSALLEGPAAGTNSVVLSVASPTQSWTATANDPWLHLDDGNQSGTGSTNVVFTFDANAGATRTGTLTLAGQTLTITQAGATYVAANTVVTLVPSGLNQPHGMAVDGAGNVYIADYGNNAIEKWSAADGSFTTLVTPGLSSPQGVAVDGAGNLYIADGGNDTIDEYLAATSTFTNLVTGLGYPAGVAVDGAGNVYIADTGNDSIEEWIAATGTFTNLITGLYYLENVAVDAAGNVYVAYSFWEIDELTAANGQLNFLTSDYAWSPLGVAVDGSGNVYLSSYGDGAVEKWTAVSGAANNLNSPGNYQPYGVAVDGTGSVFIDDTKNNAIEEVPRAFVDPTPKMEPLAAGTDALPVALPATQSLTGPFAPVSDQAWLTITGVADGRVSFAFTSNPDVSRTAHINMLGAAIPITQGGLITATLSSNSLSELGAAGSDSVELLVSSPLATWTATANASWLHLSLANQSGVGKTAVTFTFDANPSAWRTGTLTIAGQTLTIAQSGFNALGTSTLLESPAAGADSVVLAAYGPVSGWTATANATWLHLDAADQAGTDSTNVVFTFDANPGATRVGTLTVAGLTLTITQAGSTYVAANPFTTLVSSNLEVPAGIAVDGAGNVYIVDSDDQAIKEWTKATGTVTTLVSSGLNYPTGIAVDGAGNVYFADGLSNVIKEWSAGDSTVTTLVSTGIFYPYGVAVNGAGNVYIADSGDNSIKEWSPADGSLKTLVSEGLNSPYSVAVDGAGNVYIADYGNAAIKEWTLATGNVTTLVTPGLSYPEGLAVDGAGNVYVADYFNNIIEKWTAATGAFTTLSTLNYGGTQYLEVSEGVAVDGAGNVYNADINNNAVEEWPAAFVDPTARMETVAAGADVLPAVLPATENLLPPFAPASDQSWLTLTGVTNGAVSFAFPFNPSVSHTAHISLLGTTIAITQVGSITASLGSNSLVELGAAGSDSVALTVSSPTGPWVATANDSWLHLSLANQSGEGSTLVTFTFDANPGPLRTGTLTIAGQTETIIQSGFNALGTSSLLEGPAGGTDSVVFAGFGPVPAWTATANDSWLHLDAANQEGTGSTNVVFTFDANSGGTRVGALTVAGLTLSVTQAGATYVAVNPFTTLVSSVLNEPEGVAVDGAGNVYIADYYDNALEQWAPANEAFSILVSGLNGPTGVGVDGAGNLYTAEFNGNTISMWTAASDTVTNLVSSGLNYPNGAAVDAVGNVYFSDAGNNAIKEWRAADSNVITLVSSGLYFPGGLRLDAAGNVYFSDDGNAAVKKWTAASGAVTTLVSSGLGEPTGVGVDGSGNVYISDYNNNAIEKWTAATGALTTLVSSGLNGPNDVAVDGMGNFYIADGNNNALEEVQVAFVDPTAKMEPMAAGADALPAVLPATENLLPPFAPASDQPWLTITGAANGIVSYAFTMNSTLVTRTAHLTVLGQSITVNQAGAEAPALVNPTWLPGGSFQFSFAGTPGASYSVWFTTNLALPVSAWTEAGSATSTAPGQFQFTTTPAPGTPAGFYSVRSP